MLFNAKIFAAMIFILKPSRALFIINNSNVSGKFIKMRGYYLNMCIDELPKIIKLFKFIYNQ